MLKLQVLLAGLTVTGMSVGTVKHIELVESFPTADAALTNSPEELLLTFNADLDMARSAVTLRGPGGGVKLSDVRQTDDPRVIRVEIDAELEAGTYLVSWTAAPVDDHGGRGRFRFEVR